MKKHPQLQQSSSIPPSLLLLLVVTAINVPNVDCFFPNHLAISMPFNVTALSWKRPLFAGGATVSTIDDRTISREFHPATLLDDDSIICSNSDKNGSTTTFHSSSSSSSSSNNNDNNNHIVLDDDNDEDDGKEEFVFEGEFKYRSDLLPSKTTDSPSALLRFFLDRDHRDLLLKGGGHPLEIIAPTPALYEEWKVNAHVVDSTPPNGNLDEEVLDIYSVVHILPGLSVEAVSSTGCKVTTDPTNHALPVYEFTLLQESYHARGTRAMVWAFNRITGSGTTKRGGPGTVPPVTATATRQQKTQIRRQKTYALSRVTVESCPTENGCRVCYYGHVKVACRLPKGCLTIFFLSKQKLQDRVSKSIVKQLEKEGVQSIDKFYEALINWINTRDREGG
jgi:hypothetical protein